MVAVIVYNATNISRGFITAYFNRITSNLYVSSLVNRGFVERFYKKLKSICSQDEKLIILIDNPKVPLGFDIYYVNCEDMVISITNIPFFK
jgi:hypothetical protein